MKCLAFDRNRRESASLKLSEKKPCWIVRGCLVAQLRPTLWDPMDCSPPGSSVHGDVLQAGMLEWVAMPASRGSSLRQWEWSNGCLILPSPGEMWGLRGGGKNKQVNSVCIYSTFFIFFCFLLKYSCIVLVSGVQHSDSIFLCYTPFKVIII